MKIAILATDDREYRKDYSAPRPYFGSAVQALVQGLPSVPEAEFHIVCCLRQPVTGRPVWNPGPPRPPAEPFASPPPPVAASRAAPPARGSFPTPSTTPSSRSSAPRKPPATSCASEPFRGSKTKTSSSAPWNP